MKIGHLHIRNKTIHFVNNGDDKDEVPIDLEENRKSTAEPLSDKNYHFIIRNRESCSPPSYVYLQSMIE